MHASIRGLVVTVALTFAMTCHADRVNSILDVIKRELHLPDSDPVLDVIKRELEAGKGDLIVNVNDATPQELQTIPCIGEKLAKKIIASRTYEEVEELNDVKGIGDYTFNCMRPFVKTKGDTERR